MASVREKVKSISAIVFILISVSIILYPIVTYELLDNFIDSRISRKQYSIVFQIDNKLKDKVNSSSINVHIIIYNLNDMDINIKDNCTNYNISNIYVMYHNYLIHNNTIHLRGRNARILESRTAYPYMLYEIPLLVNIESKMIILLHKNAL